MINSTSEPADSRLTRTVARVPDSPFNLSITSKPLRRQTSSSSTRRTASPTSKPARCAGVSLNTEMISTGLSPSGLPNRSPIDPGGRGESMRLGSDIGPLSTPAVTDRFTSDTRSTTSSSRSIASPMATTALTSYSVVFTRFIPPTRNLRRTVNTLCVHQREEQILPM